MHRTNKIYIPITMAIYNVDLLQLTEYGVDKKDNVQKSGSGRSVGPKLLSPLRGSIVQWLYRASDVLVISLKVTCTVTQALYTRFFACRPVNMAHHPICGVHLCATSYSNILEIRSSLLHLHICPTDQTGTINTSTGLFRSLYPRNLLVFAINIHKK